MADVPPLGSCLGLQFTDFFFHYNQHLDINAAEYPQTAESLFWGETFRDWVPTHFTIWAAIVLRKRCQSDNAHQANPEVCAFQKTAGPNHFGRERLTTNLPLKWIWIEGSWVFLKHVCLSYFCASCPPVAAGLAGLFSLPLRLPWNSLWSHKKLTVPRFCCKFTV